MRNLTVKRRKTFVACLIKMKVYIEDPAECDTFINGVPCRKLGTLKSGEQKTFSIDNEERRLYVIADTLSREFCNDFFIIPAGECDVEVSGKNKFNPANGNAFRFDGVDDQQVLKNRKRGTKIGTVVMICSILLGIIIGISSTLPLIRRDKTFSCDGMEITLTNEFRKIDLDGFSACYGTTEVSVFILKESFSLIEGFEDLTLAELGDLVLQANEDLSIPLTTLDGVTYFEYERLNPENGNLYYFITCLYKSADAFWIVEFATAAENREQYSPLFIEWAQTVTFNS